MLSACSWCHLNILSECSWCLGLYLKGLYSILNQAPKQEMYSYSPCLEKASWLHTDTQQCEAFPLAEPMEVRIRSSDFKIWDVPRMLLEIQMFQNESTPGGNWCFQNVPKNIDTQWVRNFIVCFKILNLISILIHKHSIVSFVSVWSHALWISTRLNPELEDLTLTLLTLILTLLTLALTLPTITLTLPTLKGPPLGFHWICIEFTRGPP